MDHARREGRAALLHERATLSEAKGKLWASGSGTATASVRGILSGLESDTERTQAAAHNTNRGAAAPVRHRLRASLSGQFSVCSFVRAWGFFAVSVSAALVVMLAASLIGSVASETGDERMIVGIELPLNGIHFPMYGN